MAGKKWGLAAISAVATFLFFWYLLDAIKNVDTYSLPLTALILLVLFSIATFTCPWKKKGK